MADTDYSKPFIGMGAGQRRQAALTRELRKQQYQGTALDDYLGGIFGGEAGGSVLDPNREARVQANDIGQKLGIGLDIIDAPKALAMAALPAVAGRIKNVGRGATRGGADDALFSSLKKNATTLKGTEFAGDGNVLDNLRAIHMEAPVPLRAPTTQQDIAARVKPKVSARGPSLGTPEADAAFRAKYGRDPIHTMTEEQRVEHFGPGMAESPDAWMSDLRSRKPLNIPGGLEGDLTLADSAKISAQGIDYNELDPRLAQAIHEKLLRSVIPDPANHDLERFGRLMFGITSGNAPITKNLLEFAQMRPRSTGELDEWAKYSPAGPNEQLPGDYLTELNRAINKAYGVQAGERGGTGVANTANRQHVSDLAKMYQQDPSFFVKREGEPDAEFVERLMNQVRGLGPKTGSLGMAMTDPVVTNISAIDRHIADITRGAVSQDPATKAIYDERMLKALNNELRKSQQAGTLETARRRVGAGAEDIEGDKFRDIVSTPQAMVYRSKATGEVNPAVPEHLRNLPFYEPEQAQVIGPLYSAALRNIQAGGEKRGLGGFGNQWFDWDYQRSRAEPHAALNKHAVNTPRLTPEEYALVRDTFSGAGAMNTKKEPATGRLKPLSPVKDWRRLIYGAASPAALGVTAGLAGGAAALGQDEELNAKLSEWLRRAAGSAAQ